MPQSTPIPTCSVLDCEHALWSRGLCNMHYRRLWKAGLPPTLTMQDRFWAKVDKDGPIPTQCPDLGPCWLWTAHTDKDRYGKFDRKRSHRLSWEWAHGPIPAGLFVCHYCDTPPCVNPAHLFLGTAWDNTHDCMAKGRLPTGDRHFLRQHPECNRRGEMARNVKLKEEDVLAIRAAYRLHEMSYAMLGSRYGVSGENIYRIVHRKNWKHI